MSSRIKDYIKNYDLAKHQERIRSSHSQNQKGMSNQPSNPAISVNKGITSSSKVGFVQKPKSKVAHPIRYEGELSSSSSNTLLRKKSPNANFFDGTSVSRSGNFKAAPKKKNYSK